MGKKQEMSRIVPVPDRAVDSAVGEFAIRLIYDGVLPHAGKVLMLFLVFPAGMGRGLPDSWVISTRPAHPALVSEEDFIAVQGIRAGREGAVPGRCYRDPAGRHARSRDHCHRPGKLTPGRSAPTNQRQR
jgi:hypothetical protein